MAWRSDAWRSSCCRSSTSRTRASAGRRVVPFVAAVGLASAAGALRQRTGRERRQGQPARSPADRGDPPAGGARPGVVLQPAMGAAARALVDPWSDPCGAALRQAAPRPRHSAAGRDARRALPVLLRAARSRTRAGPRVHVARVVRRGPRTGGARARRDAGARRRLHRCLLDRRAGHARTPRGDLAGSLGQCPDRGRSDRPRPVGHGVGWHRRHGRRSGRRLPGSRRTDRLDPLRRRRGARPRRGRRDRRGLRAPDLAHAADSRQGARRLHGVPGARLRAVARRSRHHHRRRRARRAAAVGGGDAVSDLRQVLDDRELLRRGDRAGHRDGSSAGAAAARAPAAPARLDAGCGGSAARRPRDVDPGGSRRRHRASPDALSATPTGKCAIATTRACSRLRA